EMGTNKPYADYYLSGPFREAIKRGEIPMSALDDKVRRNLRVMFATHLIGGNATHKFAGEGGSAGIKAFYEITPLEGILRRVGERTDVTFSEGFPQPPVRRRRPTTNASGVATAPSSEPTTAQIMAASPEMIERAVRAARQVGV